MKEATEFFKMFLETDAAPRVAVENPIMHRYDKEIIGRGPDQCAQPWMFGDMETKVICLWLKNLPPLVPYIKKKPSGVKARVWKMPPGPNRSKERSRFFWGVARAMARQRGSLK